ncbi:hypothetical protein BDN72DRAFT_956061 [Pluteus cervinus]|uniref:Uncharacterized protein n=1 Tax=Pluteus cervinus TaxID=181527 RepID=A0ACD3B8G8_9AGAR|nr:hypothetical protein BDN72DRAFT_956061 [Pluteus cervinus]
MTKLPPGFSHELPQHLRDHCPKVDEQLGVPVLDFNKFCCGAHGFSALIKTEIDGEPSHLTLFDTGPDSTSLVRNISAMHIPVEQIERVITSHWHSDHTGGLLSFLSYRNEVVNQLNNQRQQSGESSESSTSTTPTTAIPQVVIDVHPDRPEARGIAPGPNFNKVICAIPVDPKFDEIEGLGGVLEKRKEGHSVASGMVWVSGEIPRVTEWEEGILGGMRWVVGEENGNGRWVNEPHIMDERYAAIDVAGKGLIIFSACSHAGIVNVIKDAVNRFSRPVYMVVGGLHLAGPEFGPRIPLTVDFLSTQLRPCPTYVLPMHCSGFRSKAALENAFGEGCVPAGVGLKVEIIGDRTLDERLPPSSY